MKKLNSILPLIFLAIMFGFGIYAFNLYSQLEKTKLALQGKTDELEKEKNKIVLLQEQNQKNMDSLQKSISESSSPQINRIFDSVKSVNTNITKLTNPDTYNQAAQLEKEGFTALKNNQFDLALVKFTAAEKALPSYHMVYEIGKLLRKNTTNFTNPSIQQQIKDSIVKKYSWGAPKILLDEIKPMPAPVKPLPATTVIPQADTRTSINPQNISAVKPTADKTLLQPATSTATQKPAAVLNKLQYADSVKSKKLHQQLIQKKVYNPQ